jgi:hypothetical protein
MERTAEEWGRIAVSLPGWRWMPGMLEHRHQLLGGWLKRRSIDSDYFNTGHEARLFDEHAWPDPDDPATEGCLIRLLGPVHEAVWYTGDCDRWVVAVGEERRLYTSLGRACIAGAEALGRWPGGAA